jgi:hypothetical protein
MDVTNAEPVDEAPVQSQYDLARAGLEDNLLDAPEEVADGIPTLVAGHELT